jgi:hypothetical protein
MFYAIRLISDLVSEKTENHSPCLPKPIHPYTQTLEFKNKRYRKKIPQIQFPTNLKIKKTMRKTFFLSALLALAALLTSCSDETKEVTLNLSTAAISVEAAQTTASFTITADIDWRIAVTDNWVSAAPAAGNGNATIMLVVQANEGTTPRATVLTVTGGDKSQEVTVSQAAKPVPPGRATVSGKDSNCPEATATVTLTAEAAGATSFAWYKGETLIAGATNATYEVPVTGIYYAAGVNADGEGAKSNPKTVTIYDDCRDSGAFSYNDLLGDYTALGVPVLLQIPGSETWNASIQEPSGGRDTRYTLAGWPGLVGPIDVGIDIVNGKLSPDTYTVVATDSGMDGYFNVFYIIWNEGVGDLILIDDFNIKWDGRTQSLDYSGQVNGYDLMVSILAIDMSTGQLLGLFSDAYANLVLTKDGASGLRMKGTRMEGGVKDPATGLIQYEMFKNIRSIKRVSMNDGLIE